MMQKTSAFACGALFGVGLLISGMTKPDKVSGFLDFFGKWDGSLMFVMVGAIGVHLVLIRLIARRTRPLYSETFVERVRRNVDAPLLLGASLFGIGWGLAGYCPGPALVALGTLNSGAVVFVVAMVLGMVLQHATFPAKQGSVEPRPEGPIDA